MGARVQGVVRSRSRGRGGGGTVESRCCVAACCTLSCLILSPTLRPLRFEQEEGATMWTKLNDPDEFRNRPSFHVPIRRQQIRHPAAGSHPSTRRHWPTTCPAPFHVRQPGNGPERTEIVCSEGWRRSPSLAILELCQAQVDALECVPPSGGKGAVVQWSWEI